jgi:hypothetical protein
MIEGADLQQYLTYLRAVPEAFDRLRSSDGSFARPSDAPIGGITGVQAMARMLNALVEARRVAREQTGLSQDDVERATDAVAWLRAHATDLDEAERGAEAPFMR